MIKKTKIGLALGSGGPRGLAHIGVIKALVETGIKPHIITGTSSGSVIGGLYATLQDIDEIERIFVNISLPQLAAMFADITRGSGIIKGNRLEKFLNKYIRDVVIEDLDVTYASVASNLHTAQDVIITHGSLTKAIRASTSIPAIFDVYQGDDGYLIDGGITQPVPIRAARQLGATCVIAVNLDGYHYEAMDVTTKPGMTKIGAAALKLLRYRLSKELCREADFLIEPDVANFTWINLADKKLRIEMINRGYRAARDQLPNIIAKLTDIK